MYTLGINAAYHDSSAVLIKDGQLIAAAEDERFTAIKHGKRPIPFSAYELPYAATAFCLKQAGLVLGDIDHIAYSFDPGIFSSSAYEESITLPMSARTDVTFSNGGSIWDPLFTLYTKQAPDFLADGAPHHLAKFFVLRGKIPRWHFVDHHLSHAVSAFFPSPFASAAVMTIDGRGEKSTTSYYHASGSDMELLESVEMPHSLGILYEKVTTYLGFLHSSDEYKVMALASFGEPRYLEEFRRMIYVDGGRYTIEPVDFTQLFGQPRLKGDPFEQKHFDVAQSLQKVLEETVLKLCRWLKERTGEENLCLAGGVALNCVMNGRIRDHGPFKNIWIQPAAGDAGTSLGAALWIDACERRYIEAMSTVGAAAMGEAAMLAQPGVVMALEEVPVTRQNNLREYTMNHVYWGPGFSDEEIEAFLKRAKIPYTRLDDVPRRTAEILSQNKILGWFQGRMEFGPRALGARSILASPIPAEMQQKLNEIKDREDFRPVAPVVLEEEATNWFVNAQESPFMLFINEVVAEKSERIAAVCHVDRTARIQTIRREQNQLYYDTIKEFHKLTGVPILVNTSFNTQGKPIVCTPRDAAECFFSSPLDGLVMGSFYLEK